MRQPLKALPKWILIVSGLFALLEIMVSLALWFSPESVVDEVDLTAKGVNYLIYMWAVRQFALGFIFGYATMKRSSPMLTIAYTFFAVMMAGDLLIGIVLSINELIISALVMLIISLGLLYIINRRQTEDPTVTNTRN